MLQAILNVPTASERTVTGQSDQFRQLKHQFFTVFWPLAGGAFGLELQGDTLVVVTPPQFQNLGEDRQSHEQDAAVDSEHQGPADVDERPFQYFSLLP